MAITVVGHPFDTVKIRLATQPTQNKLYDGVVDCVKKTVKWEGVRGFYKGVGSPLAGQMFFRAVLFTSFGQASHFLKGDDEHLTPIKVLGAGLITGLCVSFIEGPIDFFKSQLQVQFIKEKVIPGYKSPYKNVFDAGRQIINQRGIVGAYQGIIPTLLRNIPANGCYFLMYDRARAFFAGPGQDPATLPKKYIFASGAMSGIVYWVTFYPIDCLKSAIQSDNANPAERNYKNLRDAAQKFYAEGGVARFYRGFTPCFLRSIPANAVLLGVFEIVRGLLG